MQRLVFAVALGFLLLVPGSVQAQKALTNADVIQLSKIGLGDDVVIAKIRQVDEVDFQLEIEDLTKLNQAGLSGPIIAAMLDRVNGDAGVARADSAGTETLADSHAVEKAKWMDIRLLEGDKRIRLVPAKGDITQTGFIIGFVFLDYPGLHARIRTQNVHPTIVIKSQYDPTNFYYLGKLDSNDGENTRSLKISKKGGAFSETSRIVPASRWYADYEASEVAAGTWHITPKRDLEAGEYGIVVEGGLLYDFGVDR